MNKKFSFTFTAPSLLRGESKKVQDDVHNFLRSLGAENVEFLIADHLPIDEVNVDITARKIKNYLEKVERSDNIFSAVAASFDVENPFEQKIQSLKTKKIFSASDKNKIDEFYNGAHLAANLLKVKQALVPLSEDDPELAELRFQQEILRRQIRFPDVLKRPEKIEQSVWRAFEEYRTLYAETYRNRDLLHRRIVADFFRNEKIIEKKLLAVHSLRQIKLLSDGINLRDAENLEKRFSEIQKKYKRCAGCTIPGSKLLQVLTDQSACSRLALHDLLPEIIFRDFEHDLNATLENLIENLRAQSVLQMLSERGSTSVRKLCNLVSLADLEKVAKLFSERTAQKLTIELQKILDPLAKNIVSFGEFAPKTTMLATATDAKKLTAEFEKFVLNRMKKTRGKILLR